MMWNDISYERPRRSVNMQKDAKDGDSDHACAVGSPYRSRSIVKFGQFGGQACQQNLGETQSCQPDRNCEDKQIDCGNDFQCPSGRCIKQRLKCNSDNDCGDFADEDDCEQDPKSPCRQQDVEESEVARTAGTGVNVLGAKANGIAFDNSFFNGLCNKMRDGNTRTYYRLPWNAASVNYQTKADKSFTSESFSDSASVVTKIMSEKTGSVEGSASIKFSPTEMKKNKKKKNKEFLRVHGKIQLANFQMRTRDFALTSTFIDDVNALPTFYSKAAYYSFLEMYGTHYAASGNVGGNYDLVYVLDKTVLKARDMNSKDVKDCLGFNLGLEVDAPGISGDASLKHPKCKNLVNETTVSGEKVGVIEKTLSFVEGGTTAAAAKLNEQMEKGAKVDINDFVDWASSLVEAPVVIKSKNSPINSLIPNALPDSYTKKQNLQRAIQDYIDEHSVCKCQPCKNGGTVVVLDGLCLCKCPHLFEGVACQIPSAVDKGVQPGKPSSAIDGQWSCYTDSSPCVNNEKSQIRHCNNPAPKNGGKTIPRETDEPDKIECQYGSWGQWSECDPCRQIRYRSRSIVAFGQFGGTVCRMSLGDEQQCIPDEDCQEVEVDCKNDFQCESGKCIKQRLKCNVDNDCGDSSDEVECDRDPRPPCGQNDIEIAEVARTAGMGVNILGVKANMNPFNNEFYNGVCNRVRDGNTRTYYRQPWNVAGLVYRTEADKSFTSETYSDATTLMTKIISEQTESLEASISVKYTRTEKRKPGNKVAKPDETGETDETGGDGEDEEAAGAGNPSLSIGAEAGIDTSKEKAVTQLKELTRLENKEFLRITGKIQLASFQMRNRGLELSRTFIDDVNALPSFYEPSPYFAFLEMYGTHYATSGSVGGKYDLVYVLNSVVLKNKDMTTNDVKECLGYRAGVSLEASGLQAGANVKRPKCKNVSGETGTSPDKSAVIDKVVSLVEGGTVAFAAKLSEKLKKNDQIDVDDFAEWAGSLVDAPVTIKQRTAPIYSLIPVDLKDSYTKKQNLQKAIEDYIDEHSVCKCQPCQNGGTPIVVDGECLCKCMDLYHGVACQMKKPQLDWFSGPAPINGQFGCWKDTSVCVNNEKTQRRLCNNPAPQRYGKICNGASTRTIFCLDKLTSS
ncbi:uncharacterized protein PAF06_019357 [Gastrophryne carolinensis]